MQQWVFLHKRKNLFTEIKTLKDEQEDIAKQVQRLAKNLNTDMDLLNI